MPLATHSSSSLYSFAFTCFFLSFLDASGADPSATTVAQKFNAASVGCAGQVAVRAKLYAQLFGDLSCELDELS
jgi:hypothetical protein